MLAEVDQYKVGSSDRAAVLGLEGLSTCKSECQAYEDQNCPITAAAAESYTINLGYTPGHLQGPSRASPSGDRVCARAERGKEGCRTQDGPGFLRTSFERASKELRNITPPARSPQAGRSLGVPERVPCGWATRVACPECGLVLSGRLRATGDRSFWGWPRCQFRRTSGRRPVQRTPFARSRGKTYRRRPRLDRAGA